MDGEATTGVIAKQNVQLLRPSESQSFYGDLLRLIALRVLQKEKGHGQKGNNL